jgi:hypothetical protein
MENVYALRVCTTLNIWAFYILEILGLKSESGSSENTEMAKFNFFKIGCLDLKKDSNLKFSHAKNFQIGICRRNPGNPDFF